MKPPIYFLVPTGILSHIGMVVVEGLVELGYEITMNGFKAEQIISPDLCRDRSPIFTSNLVHISANIGDGILIVDSSQGVAPYTGLLSTLIGKRPIICLNMDDSVNFADFPEGVVAFCTHQNRHAKRFGNIFSVPFGLSGSLIRNASFSTVHKRDTKPSILENFRSTFQQGVRNFCYLSLVPNLRRHLEVRSGITDSLQYKQLLQTSHGVLCYGGEIFRSFANNPKLETSHKFRNFAYLSEGPVVLRWDSWRFWECCAFGCAPFMLDFAHYGLELEVSPSPFEHYIPIKFGEEKILAEDIATRLEKNPDFLLGIGANAKNWAFQHYTPAAIARYILRTTHTFYNTRG